MQTNLLPGLWTKDRFAFGGALLKGSHPKKKRCFRPNLPLHVVMRSSKAVGQRSLFLRSKQVAKILNTQASKHFVKLYAVANAGNHLHLLIQAPSQEHLSNFLRAISGRIAQLSLEGAQSLSKSPELRMSTKHGAGMYTDSTYADKHHNLKQQQAKTNKQQTQANNLKAKISDQESRRNEQESKPSSFWDARPFSRIVSWGRDFKHVARYIGINSTEMLGLTRLDTRKMFEKIQHALAQGLLPKSPGLMAAGFV